MKPAEIDIPSQSAQVQAAAAFLREAVPEAELEQSLELAGVLAQLQAEEDLLLAGLLVIAAPAIAAPPERVTAVFGDAAVRLVTELARVADSGIPAGWNPGEALKPAQAEGLRKLLLSLASDVRLVLLRLAMQLVRLRHLKGAPAEEQQRAALETREIYAPLANRLGIWHVKWELEDLAFRYSQPEDYKRIAGWLRTKRAERESYIEDVRRELARELEQAGVRAEISGRPKHIYSIWRKMQRKGLAFEQVMDVLAVRVQVETVAECYAALGIVHGLWQYIPGEFDDYIATPKENNYRSLHTAVIGPARLPLEVQIRTREMHEHAELGVAAHWQYKEGRKAEASFQTRINWLRQLLEHTARSGTEPDLLDGLQAEIFEDRVYALSPKGEVVDLPRGATPLDFAYHVHTNLGHRCRGARVNNRMVPLDHRLANGDTVEIITGKQPNPSRDWLVPALGYLVSPRNRAKVRAWFRKLDEGHNREQGKDMLERELDRLGVRTPPMPELLEELGLAKLDDLYVGLGEGELTVAQVAGAVHRLLREHEPDKPRAFKPNAVGQPTGMVVDGIGDLLSSIAKCCRPVPPEPIAGYITLGRGVSIHRADCANLLRMRDLQPRRVLAVDWGRSSPERTFPTAIVLHAFDRKGLTRDVTSVLADEQISISAMNVTTNPAENTAQIDITVTVHGLDELSRLLSRFASLPNVISARRRH